MGPTRTSVVPMIAFLVHIGTGHPSTVPTESFGSRLESHRWYTRPYRCPSAPLSVVLGFSAQLFPPITQSIPLPTVRIARRINLPGPVLRHKFMLIN